MKRWTLFGIVFALLTSHAASQVYVQRGNLWTISLGKNSEHLLMLFRNGEMVVVTENEESRVTVPWDEIFKNQGPSELMVVIHNHLRIGRWSEPDMRLYRRLKEEGFRGEFLCRLGTGKVIRLRED